MPTPYGLSIVYGEGAKVIATNVRVVPIAFNKTGQVACCESWATLSPACAVGSLLRADHFRDCGCRAGEESAPPTNASRAITSLNPSTARIPWAEMASR